ncbi:hypothetical protein PBI_JACE_59 [Gordonia phage Jace]|uniref:Uncharacterized protein n=1 Tax=Gordonia phage Jace TaxID=2182360 RepID=A0A2U8UJ32_9CAUD|nr:hypothetical protein HOT28_gp59 [Gordonia phage Jace]AWN03679.1 hypothetical protein PBI_JACE_59 [Gordonia phage Jace]
MSRYTITPTEAHNAAAEIMSEYDEIRTYSGRGMFGRECLALVGSGGSGAPTEFMFDLAVALSTDGDGDVELWDVRERITALANDMRTDSLGRSTVYYWPNVTVDGVLNDD